MKFEKGRDFKSLFGANELIEHLEKKTKKSLRTLPSKAILCFSPTAINSLQDEFEQSYLSLGARISPWQGQQVIVVSDFGIGAPAAVAQLEQIVACGVESVLVIGSAGALKSHLQPGQIIVCEGAFADEGTSRHYGANSEIIVPSLEQSKNWKLFLQGKEAKIQSGLSWTTDAPYRESIAEVNYYSERGALSVEMEASAMFQAGHILNCSVSAAFVISDLLTTSGWQPHFGEKPVKDGMKRLLQYALEFLK